MRFSNVEISHLDGEDDHIHILFETKPTTDLVKFVNTLKGATARRVRNEFPELKDKQADSFWNDSYCLISAGQVSLDVLTEYVENQRPQNPSGSDVRTRRKASRQRR